MEFMVIFIVVLFVVLYRQSNGTSVYKFVVIDVDETIYEGKATATLKAGKFVFGNLKLTKQTK